MGSESFLEIEVKFFLEDMDFFREKLISQGFQKRERVLETNLRFEDSEYSLIRHRRLLRLRKDIAAKLTFKSDPSDVDKDFKVHREIEVLVNDFDRMKQILELLGFHQEQVYEKYRETFICGTTQFCMDTMPYGDFLEIEGEKKDIIRFVSILGLSWERRILYNYLAMFEKLKQMLDLSFTDVTFDNFKHINMDFSDYCHLFEAGKG